MGIREIKAKDGARECRIFVSSSVKNEIDDGRIVKGYWYIVKGGQVGRFVCQYIRSGKQLDNLVDYDVFNINGRCDTKERFAELLANYC